MNQYVYDVLGSYWGPADKLIQFSSGYTCSKTSSQWSSNPPVGLQGGNHIAEYASEGKEEDEGARNEASQDEADEHGLG